MDYERIRNWQFPDVVHEYGERDTMLYALATGYGCNPLDARQLRYVYEQDLAVAPTMTAVLGYPGFWMGDPATGIDALRVVHAEQRMTLHAPLRASGTVVGHTAVRAIVDKGAERGALVYIERTVTDRDSGTLLATVEQVNFCRGDGGLERSDPPREALPPVPERTPDAVCELPTMPQAALLYRLCGDRNPLHADPATAAAAGFERPILHGLCTLGVATHAVLRTYGEYEPTAVPEVAVRFSAPLFPGETVRTELWRDGDKVQFRASALERGVTVLTNGIARLGR